MTLFKFFRKLIPLLIVTALAVSPALAAANHNGAVSVAPAITNPVEMACPFQNEGGDFLDRGFYITFPGDTLNTVTLQYLPIATETFSITLTARLNTYDGTLVGQATESFAATSGVNQMVTFDFGGASVPPGSIITFTQTVDEGEFYSIYYDVGTGPLGEAAPGLCDGFTETEYTTPPLDTFRRDTVGAIVTGSLTTGGGDGVPDNPSQAGEHANSHACEDNPGKANEHRPENIPPCR